MHGPYGQPGMQHPPQMGHQHHMGPGMNQQMWDQECKDLEWDIQECMDLEWGIKECMDLIIKFTR